ncbi:G2/mitotic-specific cyclin-B3 [Sparganum proliferum]
MATNHQPHLGGRPVFGNITNHIDIVTRPKDASLPNSLHKNNYHPGRRRRKQSPSSSIESFHAKSARRCDLPNNDESSAPLVEESVNGAPVNWSSDSSQSADQHNIPTSCPSPSRAPSSAPTKLGHSTPVNLTEPHPEKPRSVIAFDVVRAAFTKRIRLEDFLTECKCADFSFAAMDRSPVARMMEGTDYVIGIMAYEQRRESKPCFQLDDFISSGRQPSITPDMVTTLADWMVEVQENFAFNHETIHLAWGLLYSCLSHSSPVPRREIQLMACAAIMVACKHEERQMPKMSDFLYITDNAYTKDEFIEAEQRLLVSIDFNVHRPNPYVFLRRYARVLDAHNSMIQFMSRFLLEAGMHSHSISLCRESKKAAAVLWLARRVLRNPTYTDWLRRPEIAQLHRLLKADSRLQAFYRSCATDKGRTTSVVGMAELWAASLLHNNKRPALIRSRSDGDASSPVLTVGGRNPPPSDAVSLASAGSENVAPLAEHRAKRGRLGSPPVLRRTLAEKSQNKSVPPGSPAVKVDAPSPDMQLLAKLQQMRSIDDQRRPFWPPILEHVTGYEESDLVPLALEYHRIALILLAEVARGGQLESSCTPSPATTVDSHAPHERAAAECDGGCACGATEDSVVMVGDLDPCQSGSYGAADTRGLQQAMTGATATEAQTQRCISPGGHQLRRQVVTKYCSSAFLNVADAYPQLSFENLIPYYPEIQCSDDCACFVCSNLVTKCQPDFIADPPPSQHSVQPPLTTSQS